MQMQRASAVTKAGVTTGRGKTKPALCGQRNGMDEIDCKGNRLSNGVKGNNANVTHQSQSGKSQPIHPVSQKSLPNVMPTK